jgi:hypothetical protein
MRDLPFLLLIISGYTSSMPAQSSGAFTETGAMTADRTFHRATLLWDGQVLITGGNSLLARAELYNPATGKFTATSDMTRARFGHSATLLPDG